MLALEVGFKPAEQTRGSSAGERAQRRTAHLSLPSTQLGNVDRSWFGERFMAPLRYGLGLWPYIFIQQEMEASCIFCGHPSNAVLRGKARLEALGKLEFLGNIVVDVETVALVIESRDMKEMRYIVCGMADGSHVCSCRRLQELGLCCRHFWMAMWFSADFKFHVGLLNRRWLTVDGLRKQSA